MGGAMNFDQLDQLMRVYETINDQSVLPNILDGCTD